jgi:hypothetical protein
MRKNSNRRSTSFTQDEVELACDLFMGLLAGRDMRVLIHRKEFRGLTSRFLRMREALRSNVNVRDVNGESERSSSAGRSRAAAV